jgi:hypothetical protein
MTRLTDAQIREAREFADTSTDTMLAWRTAFAHRIAALAVQEVEREHDARTFELECAKGDIATLTAQLAEARKERDMARIARDVWMIQARGDCGDAGELHATPSPEAREVESEVFVSVEIDHNADDRFVESPCYRVRFTPADAKRIVAMAQSEGTDK